MSIRSEKILKQVRILRRKCRTSFPLEMFFEEGNGLKALKERTGRFSDFKGVFVITGPKDKPFYVSSSKTILKEVQKNC